jgi:spore coat polysaccharide biosynthesis protein SpsF
MGKIVCIIQARMGSTRLPGKVIKKIKGETILYYVVERVKQSKLINQIIVATTTKQEDDVIVEEAERVKVSSFRGSEEDVLSRYYHAAKKYNADIVVRVTSDCPLIDPAIVDQVISKHIETNADYTSNCTERTYPRGLDTEVFNFDVLKEAYKNATQRYEKEHVTPYILEHPDKFKLINIEAKGKLRRPDIRITLDTIEDFELINRIILFLPGINFTTEDIIDFINQSPKLIDINKHVKQKGRMD